MTNDTPQAIRLQDYTPPAYLIDQVELRFELDESRTVVHSSLAMRRNPDGFDPANGELRLDGQGLRLNQLRLEGRPLGADEYRIDEESLTITAVPEAFTLEVETEIDPQANTALEGLYLSGGNFCTQCEAEGFRRITYFLDRPDVMARFTTTIVADKGRYPVLLSNGNPVAERELEDGRHLVTWEDPFPKPSYLFALVAGNLACFEDAFTTASGRPVTLRIYVQHHNIDKCEHAMRSLKLAMRWDEERFGREYDLDIYMIVAVDDFNMGAMENKGLNVFNSKFVLARHDTATDVDYQWIEGVIGHEYFHNWSGNRVTCRDWFQLSLKEGLTVFRDQEFSSDVQSRAVKRIQDVRELRSRQFPEDAGPMAHPVRPDSYIEINNFYTATVYEKGAEVVRMIHRLLGEAGFRRGLDLYFERHDGQAVTVEEFVRAMEEGGGIDLGRFRRWYAQAGTPRLGVGREYDAENRRYTLTLRQHTPPTPGQADKLPLHLPVAMALIGGDGRPLPLRLEGETEAAGRERVLSLYEAEQRFVFVDVDEEPVPSLLRGFSAPVYLDAGFDDAELAFLMAHDDDPFNRWEAGQQLAARAVLRGVAALREGGEPAAEPLLEEAFGRLLGDPGLDPALAAEALALPGEGYLAELVEVVDPEAIHLARRRLRRRLAEAHREGWLAAYHANCEAEFRIDAAAIGRRTLKNLALSYLMELEGDEEAVALCLAQFRDGGNMSDVMAALRALADSERPEREEALAAFYERWREDTLVLDKWFSLQATSRREDTLARVRGLLEHPAFSIRNPNKVRALIGAFCIANPARFHAADGAGYRFLGEQAIRLDALNPQVAARMLAPFTRWRRFDPARQALMREQLERIRAVHGLSKDSYEVVAKSLGG